MTPVNDREFGELRSDLKAASDRIRSVDEKIEGRRKILDDRNETDIRERAEMRGVMQGLTGAIERGIAEHHTSMDKLVSRFEAAIQKLEQKFDRLADRLQAVEAWKEGNYDPLGQVYKDVTMLKEWKQYLAGRAAAALAVYTFVVGLIFWFLNTYVKH
jgi:hypothetical protein